ncbi:MAG: hypothetical protein GY739_16165, partial [Mesoflavibacter sp.]|nr:hypothetical protein [Mesoflavibacter sp.]
MTLLKNKIFCIPFWRGVLSTILMLFTVSFLLIQSVMADSFTIVDGQEETTQQTLNANESGVIEEGGQLNTGANTAINNPVGEGQASVTNSGTITTAGVDADGIFSSGDNATLTNSGTITTEGDRARGIISSGDNATLTNSGTIRIEGDYADGIISSGDNATLTNSGTITTAG